MPTIGEVYSPLVRLALEGDKLGHQKIIEVGHAIHENHKDLCPRPEDGIRRAKVNLSYYCQYYSEPTPQIVKAFYGLDKDTYLWD